MAAAVKHLGLPSVSAVDLPERRPDLEVSAHIHLNPSFPGMPFRREHSDRGLPAAAMSPRGSRHSLAPRRASAQPGPSRRSTAFGVGPRFASLIGGRAEYCHASRVHCTVTSSGLPTLPQVAGQAERTGDLPLDESRDRPVVVPHALEVDAQPDEAVTGAVPGPRAPPRAALIVAVSRLIGPEESRMNLSRAYGLPVAGLP